MSPTAPPRRGVLRAGGTGSAAAAVPFPPPRDSPVRAAVDAAREERTVTRGWRSCAGGRKIRAPSTRCSRRNATSKASTEGGLAGFGAEVERRARAFMRESDA